MSQKTSSIVVTYHPDVSTFYENIIRIAEQSDIVFLIDNTEDKGWLEGSNFPSNVQLQALPENEGIAYAQNIGIIESLKQSVDFIITFDQDTVIPENFIAKLIGEYNGLMLDYNKIACIGPTVVNERNGIVYEKFFKDSIALEKNNFLVKSLISTGTLFPASIFLRVGLNKSEWFIDFLDTEWCFRARYLGYKVIMTRNIQMEHNIGSKDVSLPMGITVLMHSPFRLAYIFRNFILALKLPHFSFKYKCGLLFFLPIRFIIQCYLPQGKERAKYMFKGIKCALTNKLGKID